MLGEKGKVSCVPRVDLCIHLWYLLDYRQYTFHLSAQLMHLLMTGSSTVTIERASQLSILEQNHFPFLSPYSSGCHSSSGSVDNSWPYDETHSFMASVWSLSLVSEKSMFVKFLSAEIPRGPITSQISKTSLEGDLFILDLTAMFYSMWAEIGQRDAKWQADHGNPERHHTL